MKNLWCFFLLLVFTSVASAQPLELSGIVACQTRGWAVLRNQTELNRFVERIPKWRMQKMQPAPLNPDPILQNPEVDFEDHVLLVVWSDNIHIIPRILKCERAGRDLQVEIAFQTPVDYRNYQAPYSHGRYLLLELDRFDGDMTLVPKETVIERQPLP